MEESTLLVINPQVSIDIVRKDIKNMHLAVYPPTGRVRIAAPLSINDEAVRLFAISKLGWIKRNQILCFYKGIEFRYGLLNG